MEDDVPGGRRGADQLTLTSHPAWMCNKCQRVNMNCAKYPESSEINKLLPWCSVCLSEETTTGHCLHPWAVVQDPTNSNWPIWVRTWSQWLPCFSVSTRAAVKWKNTSRSGSRFSSRLLCSSHNTSSFTGHSKCTLYHTGDMLQLQQVCVLSVRHFLYRSYFLLHVNPRIEHRLVLSFLSVG